MKINSFKAGKNSITFKSQRANLAGDLYLPAGFDGAKKHHAVIFSGPFNQVKEQMGAVYGKKMVTKGYVFLAFDHLGYGDSEGEVRNNEQPFIKMEGIRDAISYLNTLPFVDKDNLFGLGGCASGGYMPIVATTDKRLAAIATVSGMMDNTQTTFGYLDRETVINTFKTANEARQKQYETGEITYFDALAYEGVEPKTLPEGARREGYDYYMTQRAGAETYPNYSHRTPLTINEYTGLTSATALAPYLYTPYLGIYGERAMADTGPLTVSFFEKASEPKELFEVKGASHVSLYDIDADVDQAVEKMDKFFKTHSN